MAGKRVTIGPKPISISEEMLAAKIAGTDESVSAASPATPESAAANAESRRGTVLWLQGQGEDAHAEPVPEARATSEVTQRPDAASSSNTPERRHAVATTLIPTRTVAISAASGAIAGGVIAVCAMMFASGHILPADPRLDVVERRLASVETGAGENARKIERLNSDIAQAIDSGQAAAGAIAEQKQAISALREELNALKESLASGPETQSPVFAVAVSQLRAAFSAGRPFETELVTVYSLAEQDGEMVATITELLDAARTGVPNAASLRQQLKDIVTATPGLRIGAPQSYYDYGLALVNEYVGYSSTPYTIEFANGALTRADWYLARGDVSGAVAALSDVDPSIRQSLAPFLENASLHERVNAAINGIYEEAVALLRTKTEG